MSFTHLPLPRLVVALLLYAIAGVSPQVTGQSNTAQATADEAQVTPATTEAAQPGNSQQDNQPDTDAETIISADQARGAKPSLDYEPSESISEDRSVSFPVDI